MPRSLLAPAVLLLTVAVFACKDLGAEIAHGEYARSSAHLTVSGTDTIVEGDDDIVSSYPLASVSAAKANEDVEIWFVRSNREARLEFELIKKGRVEGARVKGRA